MNEMKSNSVNIVIFFPWLYISTSTDVRSKSLILTIKCYNIDFELVTTLQIVK